MRTIGGAPRGWTAIPADLEDWTSAYEELEWSLEEPAYLGAGCVFAHVRQKARPVGTTG
jgi:hypothetical protein